ncbi:arsenate reductase [Saccharospirillum salsuginis]|uniref:Arsenate reductase n=1 Tax=Saccharospirillum salsuginis TaxID=418750 RepID=A0A918NEJ4_9GAMM|nr:arsenate reductase [Saccharospirillum salsuginis]GGX61470.1 arsenate reductase [Saccharospirillum salsuginis]
MIRIYGIRNCDTIKKTLAWFDQQGADYEFIDYKKTPPTEDLLRSWFPHVGWENLINKRGTTWRNIDDGRKEKLNPERAIQLMIAEPSIIKRPVVEHGGLVSVGYNEQAFRDLLSLEL